MGQNRHLTALTDSLHGRSRDAWSWVALLLGWIFARNLLEGILERPHQLGFDWREEISAPMVFLHFPLFYLALFALLVLWLHVLTRRPLRDVCWATSLGYAVLLVVPIVDALVSRGRGYDLKYLLGFGSFLWAFWDPTRELAQVSPGQRVAITSGVLGIAGYVFLARGLRGRGALLSRRALFGNVSLALMAAAGFYLIAAFCGAWPAIFARWAGGGRATLDVLLPDPVGGGIAGLAKSSAALSPEQLYIRVYQMGGVIPNESRRLAVVMALPLLAALPFVLWRADPERFRRILPRLPWSRWAFYTGLVPAGAFLAFLVYKDHLPIAFENPTDWAAVFVLWSSMTFAFVAALTWNHLHDLEADRWNEPDRPLVSGLLEEDTARRLLRIWLVGAVGLALCVSYPAFLLVLAVVFLSWCYSAPPLRFKRWPGAATAVLGLMSVLSLMTGYSLLAGERTPQVFPPSIGWTVFLGVMLGFTAKDLKDALGDRASGVITLATALPERLARMITALLVALGYGIALVFLQLGAVFVVAVSIAAVGSAILTMKMRRPDTALLVVFVAFCLLTLALARARPDALTRGLPGPVVAIHGRVLSLEEEVRIHRRSGVDDSGPTSGRPVTADALRGEPAADAAEAVLRRATQQRDGPTEERARWALAQTAPPSRAAAEAARLLERAPLRTALWDWRVRSLQRSGQTAAAIEACGLALGRGLRPASFLHNRAALQLAAGTAGPSTERDLVGAFRLGEDPGELHVLTGDLRLREDAPGPALHCYQTAIALRPEAPDAWSGLGQALYAAGRGAEAVSAFHRALDLFPSDPQTLNNLGVALRGLGRFAEAESALLEARRIDPGMFEPPFNLALVCERQGRIAEARRWIQIAAALRPGFPPVEETQRRLAGDTIP